MAEVPVKTETQVAANNHKLWSSEHVLDSNRAGQVYGGQVFVEVWEDDTQLVAKGSSVIWLKRAAEAVRQGAYEIAIQTDDLARSGPATGRPTGFLGRVIIEMWDDKFVVSLSGEDSRVMLTSLKMLEES